MGAHACNLSPREMETGRTGPSFKVIFSYILRLSPAYVRPCLHNKWIRHGIFVLNKHRC